MRGRRVVESMARIRAVLFDVGGVLVTNRPDPANIARILGLDVSEDDTVSLVDHAMWFNRPAYDEGTLSDREFWDTVAGDCGLPEVRDAALAALVEEDVSRTREPEPAALDVAHQLRAAGLRLGILSNAPVCIARAIESSPWAAHLFDAFTFSGPLHLVKPAQRIYRHAAESVGASPEEILFIDDRRPNLRGAELAGMSALRWESPDQARAELVERGILSSAVVA
jgi:putative hydrolase of the HAD superfamily